MAEVGLPGVAQFGASQTVRVEAELTKRVVAFDVCSYPVSVEKVASLTSLQICQNTNDIFD